MTRYRTEIYTVSDLVRLDKNDRLIIEPKFQRRSVWRTQARSFLIDTIIKGIPMPKIYLREVRNIGRSYFEVVDGQQRLHAILDYAASRFQILPEHDAKYGGRTFEQLPPSMQRRFLEYRLTGETMDDANDEDVWRLFARLNRYTVPINLQETRHARFGGQFKQAVYELAEQHLSLFTSLRVISKTQVQRMREAELTSDILVALVDGISDIADLDSKYKQYDSDFPKRLESTELFSASLGYIETQLAETVRRTRFKNHSWFYSLTVATADALAGIPSGNGPRTMADVVTATERMDCLDQALKSEIPPVDLRRLEEALTRATSHVPERRTRHEHFFRLLTE